MAAVVDVFVYVVVLNLFIEYFPQVLSETFTLSLLTAVLLKGVLEVVIAAKNRVKDRFRQASTPLGKVVAGFLLWMVLFGSKFLVLEAVAPDRTVGIEQLKVQRQCGLQARAPADRDPVAGQTGNHGNPVQP